MVVPAHTYSELSLPLARFDVKVLYGAFPVAKPPKSGTWPNAGDRSGSHLSATGGPEPREFRVWVGGRVLTLPPKHTRPLRVDLTPASSVDTRPDCSTRTRTNAKTGTERGPRASRRAPFGRPNHPIPWGHALAPSERAQTCTAAHHAHLTHGPQHSPRSDTHRGLSRPTGRPQRARPTPKPCTMPATKVLHPGV